MRSEELVSARAQPQGHERDLLQDGDQAQNLTAPAKPFGMTEILNLPVPSEAQLRVLFGLTVSQARLAQHLASGDTVEEVAERLGIKLTTARSQLAVIFSKTGVRRQTKLVALLSRIAHLG